MIFDRNIHSEAEMLHQHIYNLSDSDLVNLLVLQCNYIIILNHIVTSQKVCNNFQFFMNRLKNTPLSIEMMFRTLY